MCHGVVEATALCCMQRVEVDIYFCCVLWVTHGLFLADLSETLQLLLPHSLGLLTLLYLQLHFNLDL